MSIAVLVIPWRGCEAHRREGVTGWRSPINFYFPLTCSGIAAPCAIRGCMINCGLTECHVVCSNSDQEGCHNLSDSRYLCKLQTLSILVR